MELGSLCANGVRALLACGGPGRIGTSIDALPVVCPANYLYLGGSLVCATDDDHLVRAAEYAAVMAFSADRLDTRGQWQWHAHVVGRTQTVTDDDTRSELEALGLFPPGMQTPSHYIRLHPEILTGFRYVHASSETATS